MLPGDSSAKTESWRWFVLASNCYRRTDWHVINRAYSVKTVCCPESANALVHGQAPAPWRDKHARRTQKLIYLHQCAIQMRHSDEGTRQRITRCGRSAWYKDICACARDVAHLLKARVRWGIAACQNCLHFLLFSPGRWEGGRDAGSWWRTAASVCTYVLDSVNGQHRLQPRSTSCLVLHILIPAVTRRPWGSADIGQAARPAITKD